jgi:hypothetical protein
MGELLCDYNNKDMMCMWHIKLREILLLRMMRQHYDLQGHICDYNTKAGIKVVKWMTLKSIAFLKETKKRVK